MSEADRIIEALSLEPHPEGGWFRETWRAPAPNGVRAASTAILYLLKSGERSHWHRVDADEIWLWQGGDALRLSIAESDHAEAEPFLLGPADRPGHLLQAVVPAHHWQAAEPSPTGRSGYALVSCVVAPAFEFAGFEMAPEGWQPGSA